MTRQVVPTHILQAIVNYLEVQPHKDVAHLLTALLEHVKPEFPDPVVPEESKEPDTGSSMKDPFFQDNDPEPK